MTAKVKRNREEDYRQEYHVLAGSLYACLQSIFLSLIFLSVLLEAAERRGANERG